MTAKFVEGAWYETRHSSETFQMVEYTATLSRPWRSGMRERWTEDGSYLTNGEKHPRDLVRRVNPPTEYKPTKKWLWKNTLPSDCSSIDYSLSVITDVHLSDTPKIFGFKTPWQKIEGSEVEE